MGYSVAITSQLGDGFPDIIVGIKNINIMFEIKDENKPPSKRQLTPDEAKFASLWRGQYSVIESLEQAIAYIKDYLKLFGK